MKPFNLETALRGEPVITRDGRPVVWGAYNPDAADGHRVACWIGGHVLAFYENGSYLSYIHNLDLFMAPRKVKLWRRTYRSEIGTYRTVTAASEGDANGWILYGDQSWSTEWEEFEVDE